MSGELYVWVSCVSVSLLFSHINPYKIPLNILYIHIQTHYVSAEIDRPPQSHFLRHNNNDVKYIVDEPISIIRQLQTTTDLTIEGNDCEPPESFPLGACEGECDDDSQCQLGLKCFQRRGSESIPGCSGDGQSGKDYCYKPELEIVEIVNINVDSLILGVCQGDCDDDSNCQPGLRCLDRSGTDPVPGVPGCSGDPERGSDYCYQPSLELVEDNGEPMGNRTLSVCQGDCDDDSECDAGLRCIFRERGEEVPGCLGNDKSGKDYCYLPSTDTPTTCDKTPKPTTPPTTPNPTPPPNDQP